MIHDYRILWSVRLTSCYMGEEIKKGVSEEFMSLRSSAKHKASVETTLSSSLVLHNNFKVHDYPGDSLELVGLWSELQCVWIIAVVVLPCWVCPFSFRWTFVLQSSCSIKSTYHLQDAVTPMLQRLGFLSGAAAATAGTPSLGALQLTSWFQGLWKTLSYPPSIEFWPWSCNSERHL